MALIRGSQISGSVASASFAVTASYVISATATTASYAFFAETASLSTRTTQIDVYVKNQSGNSIAKGVVVQITGSNNASDVPRIVTASWNNEAGSANTLGITTAAIANGSEGFVITEGVLTGIDTSNFTSGQLLYLGESGSIVGYAPTAPLHTVRLGEVIREQSNNGSIYVRIDNGYELDELHNVKINTSSLSPGEFLIRSGSALSGVWINTRQLTGSYGLTGSLSITSTAQNIFLIKNASGASILEVSQSGIITLATQSTDPAGTPAPGAIWLTSSSFFIGLE